MKNSFILIFLFAVATSQAAEPLKALLITGGCCHDYKNQQTIIVEGMKSRMNITFDLIFDDPKTQELPALIQGVDWAKKYDIVVHNQCWAKIKEPKVVEDFVTAQKNAKVGAAVIHCAMHTFRDTPSKAWDNFSGVESRRHGPKYPIRIKKVAPVHPVIKGVPDNWLTKNGELYATKPVETCTPLAEGFKDGQEEKTKQVCIWVVDDEGTRIFGTSLGHHNETMLDEVWLDLLSRGLLWSVNKLQDDGSPAEGYAGHGNDVIIEALRGRFGK